MRQRRVDFDELQRRLDHSFSDIGLALLRLALTQASAGEHQKIPDNKRLAFVGDAAIEAVVRGRLYRDSGNLQLGALSKKADEQVRNSKLAALADSPRLSLEEWLAMGDGEADNRDGRERRLADAFEAVVGAMWLDHAPMDKIVALLRPD